MRNQNEIQVRVISQEEMNQSLLQSKILRSNENVVTVFKSLSEQDYKNVKEIEEATGLSHMSVIASIQSLFKKGKVYKSVRKNAYKLSQTGALNKQSYVN